MLTDSNGILQQAGKAKEEVEKAEELEKIQLAVISTMMSSANNQLTTEKLKEEFQKDNLNGTLSGNDNWIYQGNKNNYIIEKNGNVYVRENFIIYGNSPNNLPQEFQQVEYIESTGTQYIDTEYYANGDSGYIYKYSDNKQNGVMFGAYNNDWTTGNGFYINVNRDSYNPFLHYYSNTRIPIGYNTSGMIQINKGTVYINNIQYISLNSRSFFVNVPTFIFCGNWMGNRLEQPTQYKLHFFYIYENNIFIRKFFPCYSKTTNEVGLYDTVNNQFYTNQGTGTFLKGKISGVGNINDDNKYEIPLKITTATNEVNTAIIINAPLRKASNTADYIDLKNKKIVRYISEEGTILETPIEENIEIENLPEMKDILSIEVDTEIKPSKIEVGE